MPQVPSHAILPHRLAPPLSPALCHLLPRPARECIPVFLSCVPTAAASDPSGHSSGRELDPSRCRYLHLGCFLPGIPRSLVLLLFSTIVIFSRVTAKTFGCKRFSIEFLILHVIFPSLNPQSCFTVIYRFLSATEYQSLSFLVQVCVPPSLIIQICTLPIPRLPIKNPTSPNINNSSFCFGNSLFRSLSFRGAVGTEQPLRKRPSIRSLIE